MPPLVSTILLNYKARQDTLDCLASLSHLTYADVHIIVLDNHSGDGLEEAVRADYPQVDFIQTGANLGFTGGNNIGIRKALERGADYILLLNNDTIVAPDFLNEMIRVMDADPTIGIAGPMIYYYANPDQIWSAGGAIDWRSGTTRMIGLNEMDKSQFGSTPFQVDFVSGCALLARRSLWEKSGLLDDQFFMYYEETEWCVRAQTGGNRAVLIPDAMIWHKISIQDRAVSPRTYYYMTRNRFLFLKKTHASLSTWMKVWMEYTRTFLSWSLKPKWQNRRQLRGVMLRAIYDYYRGQFGMTAL
jgi:GT2 family glycosyltransferase